MTVNNNVKLKQPVKLMSCSVSHRRVEVIATNDHMLNHLDSICCMCPQSMGQSLTFERSVMQAIELQRNFKCKNPICETQTWKLKHKLDLALLRIDRLQKQVTG